MTTLAYRDGVMAACSVVWDDDVASYHVRKVRRLRTGHLIGFAGDVAAGLAGVNWLRAGGDLDDMPDLTGVDLLLVRPTGKVLFLEDGADDRLEVRGAYHAIGGGAGVAQGAMFAGADAVTAVRAAIRHYEGSRGRVYSARL